MSSANLIVPSADIDNVKTALRLLLAANKYDARSIELKKAEDGLEILFRKDDGSLTSTTKAAGLSLESITQCLNARAFCWPVMKGNAFQSSSSKRSSLVLAPVSGLRAQCFLDLSSKESAVTLDKITFEALPSIFDQLQLTAVNHEILSLFRQQRSGIVVTNSSPKDKEICGAAVLLAFRPDALYFPEISDLDQANSALELASSNLVICSMPDNDALNALVGFVGISGNSNKAAKVLLGSYVHRRISRVCSVCARPTQAASSTLDQIPELLRPLPGSTYMFGRGCEACGHTTYRGTIGIDTAVRISSSLRKLIDNTAPVGELARCAYIEGTRVLLEDGLQKIRQGLTSFESLNKVAKSIPAAYEKAVEESRAGGDVIDVDGASSFETDDLASEMSPTAADHPRLLIVEDDPDQRKILETLFRAEGYEVFQAEHGKQALEVLECQEVELVIADLMMPHMNGSEMVKEIRAASGFSQVPILMLTAVDNPDAEYALLDAGADGYCPKNVKRKVLLKRVERLLSRG